MKKNLYPKLRLLAAAAAVAAVPQLHGATPVAPGNLDAKVNGIVVDLSWEWGNAGQAVSTYGFEGEEFPDNCDIKATHPDCNWLTYSFEGEEESLAHSGDWAAILMMGFDEDLAPENHQDEWLVLRPGAGAVYMDFWYYLHPELLDVGGYRDFPDHYYVHISRDNGASWTELWDGRWDMGNVDAVQQASLFMGEAADENTLVAFNAVSAEDQSLYFLWAVDDVEFLTADEKASQQVKLAARATRPAAATAMPVVKRHFEPSATIAAARAPQSEWLNNGLTTYRVYLGEELVADYLKARHFTEYSTKEPGTYTYKVVAWNEAEDREFAPATVDVEIGEFEFGAPRNVHASHQLQANGRYSVDVAWEAPASDLQPSYYVVYVNGKSIGWLNPDEELSMGQSGLYKGVYRFEVEAVYQYPEGTSARIGAVTAPGTVMPVENLRVTASGNDRIIEWDAPEAAGEAAVAYSVYRGDELLAERTDRLSLTDTDVPDGLYSYHVHAIYPDGQVSLPTSAPAHFADALQATLPFTETFDNGHLPANWEVALIDPNETVKDMYAWRFDNWFGIELPAGSGIEGGFASVSGVAAGMNKLESHLITPPIALPADENAILKFTQHYLDDKPGPTGAAQSLLMVSTDNGLNWEEVENVAALDNGRNEVELGDFAGSTVKLRWSFLGRNSGLLAIDNVKVLLDSQNSVTSVGLDTPSTVTVYTPSGITVARDIEPGRVASLPAGIYIVASGSSTSKIIVK